jgi:dihydroorotate dehydrogenase (NAD+) catalytic subunit
VTADLTTTLAGLRLENPVMTAAGCAGAGRELDSFLDLTVLGAFVTRSVTLHPCQGPGAPRLVETPSGVLSAAGHRNPGLQGFLATELPWLARRRVRTIVSIAGTSRAEYAELGRRLGESPGVSAIEVNLSSPNLSGQEQDRGAEDFAADPYQSAKVVEAVRRDTPADVPVLAKLRAGTALVGVARAVVKAGADALVLVNAAPALSIDPVSLRPVLGGALSGPAVGPVALRAVWDVHASFPQVPVVGVGGVRSGFDALAMVLAGASAVQVGSATFRDPSAPARVVKELVAELAARGIQRLAQVVGRAHLEEEHA